MIPCMPVAFEINEASQQIMSTKSLFLKWVLMKSQAERCSSKHTVHSPARIAARHEPHKKRRGEKNDEFFSSKYFLFPSLEPLHGGKEARSFSVHKESKPASSEYTQNRERKSKHKTTLLLLIFLLFPLLLPCRCR